MNNILIITTEGCEACDIAVDNVTKALLNAKKKINLEVNDFHNINKQYIVQNKIKDYPTVIYTINGNIVCKSVGSYPAAVYLRWIDIYFS